MYHTAYYTTVKWFTDGCIRTHKVWTCQLIDWVKVLHHTRHKIVHFRDVLLSQSLGIVLKKQNLTQQNTHKHTNKLSICHQAALATDPCPDKFQGVSVSPPGTERPVTELYHSAATTCHHKTQVCGQLITTPCSFHEHHWILTSQLSVLLVPKIGTAFQQTFGQPAAISSFQEETQDFSVS